MRETADVVIAGGGIVGLSIAYQLARRNAGRIVVLEKSSSLGEGSTGASSAVCRFKYSRAETVLLARYGIGAYRDWAAFLDLAAPMARFHATGVLWLGNGLPVHEEVARLTALRVLAEEIDDRELAQRYPSINPCPLAPDLETGAEHECTNGGGHMVELEGGYVDPMDALHDLLTAVRARGVDVRLGCGVTGIATGAGGIEMVKTSHGEFATRTLVNAAGPWCRQLDEMVGLDSPWPLRATRIQIAHVDRPLSIVGAIPVCADPPGGIYFRPQNRGQQIIIGSILEEDEREYVDPNQFDRSADELFVATKIHAAQHRLRGLGDIRNVRGYSGLYTMNVADVHPVVGATHLSGYYVANGFSGHGFKLAPAIGALVAQAIAGVRLADDPQVEPEFLSFFRSPMSDVVRSVLA